MGAGPFQTACFEWVWRFFADDGDGVDAKDICPGPNQFCFDDFEFVLRVGFNGRGDAVFALYILGHLPHPLRKAL